MFSLELYVAKQGLLSAAGHDLRLRAPATLELVPDRSSVAVTVDASSITVETAMAHGEPRADALSAHDKREIETTIRDRILETARHPRIVFRSTKIVAETARYRVEGILSIKDVERAIGFDVARIPTDRGERLEARVVVHQPDFGIRPFRALFGALAIDPDVEVRGATTLERE